jgi:hypothetical protein
MKPTGGVTYIGVSLKDLNKYFKDDAVIHVSKKFLKSYEMISGITEKSKPISMNIIDKSDVMSRTYPYRTDLLPIEPDKEAAPPVDIKVSKGDW